MSPRVTLRRPDCFVAVGRAEPVAGAAEAVSASSPSEAAA